MAFVCLGRPGDAYLFHPLAECTQQHAVALTDFGADGSTPHLYALATQTIRGEVAMVDLSTTSGDVLDADPASPGTNFFPVGALPRGIVASPKGTAAFVTTAEIGRPAIYALPINAIRPCDVDASKCNQPAPTISSWPSCLLPAPPGKVVMVADPAVGGQVRKSCSDTYQPPDESSPRGSIDQEGLGREKLIVELPTLGELVVLDAQTILDGTAGSLAPCAIEKTITLSTTVPAITPDVPPPTNAACVNPAPKTSALLGPFKAQPSDMSLTPESSGRRLYVGDVAAPLIHVLDVSSPCSASEIDDLPAFSRPKPDRQVRVSQLSVGPVLDSQKRYLYAVDLEDKSLMVYDVSDGSTTRAPLRNPNPSWNPLQPVDRIQLAAAPAGVQIVSRDAPQSSSMTTAPFGTRCDPTPCSGQSCGPGAVYKTKSDFTSGAGPITLRGTFALAGLSSGQLGVIDIDDYDAACRGPKQPSSAYGCGSSRVGGDTTDELTCGVVFPNEPRSASYVVSNTNVGRHLPGITAFPILTTKDGTVVDPKNAPRMRATLPNMGPTAQVFVNGDALSIDSTGLATSTDGARDALLMNIEDPRVQVADQNWTVQFEGPLPGTEGKHGNLLLASGQRELDDAASFCGLGVQSEASARALLTVDGAKGDLDALARIYADRVSLTDPIIDQTQGYWKSAACSFQQCQTIFGDDTAPTTSRDIPIVEAYDDHLVLGDPPAGAEITRCCFPTAVGYSIRPGHQWTVTGAVNGFFHHVIPDPVTGVCRPSCDPNVARMNGRVLAPSLTPAPVFAPDSVAVTDGMSPFAFIGPMFRFSIPDQVAPVRDMQFKFATEGGFVPLRFDLTADTTRPIVEPRAIQYLAPIDSFVISDGALEGILVVPGTLTGSVKQIF